jgi:hypothetical protein
MEANLCEKGCSFSKWLPNRLLQCELGLYKTVFRIRICWVRTQTYLIITYGTGTVYENITFFVSEKIFSMKDFHAQGEASTLPFQREPSALQK